MVFAANPASVNLWTSAGAHCGLPSPTMASNATAARFIPEAPLDVIAASDPWGILPRWRIGRIGADRASRVARRAGA